MKDRSVSAEVTSVSEGLLRQWPLPMPSSDDDKEGRGHILVVAGSRGMPGAAVLAATAALRAGAGKLVIATGASAAQSVALAIPESRAIPLSETDTGAWCRRRLRRGTPRSAPDLSHVAPPPHSRALAEARRHVAQKA